MVGKKQQPVTEDGWGQGNRGETQQRTRSSEVVATQKPWGRHGDRHGVEDDSANLQGKNARPRRTARSMVRKTGKQEVENATGGRKAGHREA